MPTISWIKVLRQGVAPNYFGESHQNKNDWVYKFTIILTSKTTLVSNTVYQTDGAARAAAYRVLDKYFK